MKLITKPDDVIMKSHINEVILRKNLSKYVFIINTFVILILITRMQHDYIDTELGNRAKTCPTVLRLYKYQSN